MEHQAKPSPWIPGAILITMLVLVGYAYIRQNVRPRPISGLIAEEPKKMMQKTTTWEFVLGGGCATHTVTTSPMPGESNEDWCARHDALVRADAIKYRPKGE